MKRINILYILVIIVIFLLLRLNRHFGKQTLVFFGFAENKEMEINLDHSITVNEIFVNPGQKVNKGMSLASVSRSSLDLKSSTLNLEIAALDAKQAIRSADLESDINKLRAQKASKESEIYSEIEQIEAEIKFNESLLKDLKSVEASPSSGSPKSSRALKKEALRKELEMSIKPLDIEIARLEALMKGPNNPLRIQKEQLQSEIQFLENQQGRLSIVAPADGVVGSVNCKAGENLNAFSTIVTFYNQKPTLVKAYVLENLILQVELGDSLRVNSTLHPEHQCGGVVVGLGSRIIEIPERLRKMPELKTYGREILVSIPSDNHFLQKEKVVLNLPPTEKNGGNNIFNPLFNFSTGSLESARK